MQDLIKYPTFHLDEPEFLLNISQLEAVVTNKDHTNCLNWIVPVPDWQIEYLYSHELYNQKYQSIGIPPHPISKIPFYARMRPYKKRQVMIELNKRFTEKKTEQWYELWVRVAQF